MSLKFDEKQDILVVRVKEIIGPVFQKKNEGAPTTIAPPWCFHRHTHEVSKLPKSTFPAGFPQTVKFSLQMRISNEIHAGSF